MDNDEFKLNETGINPVDTASENNDVYFTNVKAEKNNEQSKSQKTVKAGTTVKKRAYKEKSKSYFNICFLYCSYCSFYAHINLCGFLYERCFWHY